jgi:hypothetical protein
LLCSFVIFTVSSVYQTNALTYPETQRVKETAERKMGIHIANDGTFFLLADTAGKSIGAFVAATESCAGTLDPIAGDVEGMTGVRADTAGAPVGMLVAAQNGQDDPDSSQLKLQLPLHAPLQSTDVHVE